MQLVSGPRRLNRQIKKARTNAKDVEESIPVQYVEKCELDTHADTICAGRNCRLLDRTGHCCDVRGFHDELSEMKDVPVATVATGITTSDGIEYILVFNEVLYFGDTMDHTLINPYQIRHYGISVSDNPFDDDKPFGIDHEEVFVPFSTSGTMVYFESFYPTKDQMERCPLIVLTSESEWAPHAVELNGDRDSREAAFGHDPSQEQLHRRKMVF